MSPVALAHRRSLAKKAAAFFKNSHLCAQLAPLRPQPGDLGRLRGGLGVLVLGVLLLVLGDPAPHRLRNQIVGGGHGRDRALLLQDLANDLLLELIGVLRSRHELILFCRGKKLSPSPEDPTHSRGSRIGGVTSGRIVRGGLARIERRRIVSRWARTARGGMDCVALSSHYASWDRSEPAPGPGSR